MRYFSLALALMTLAGCAVAEVQVKDPRLAQKVSYNVRLRTVSDLAADMTSLTHVRFSAGKSNSDWRVREDRATVIAKDVPLATLMDSIAHALKCRWVRSGVAPDWAYRLTENPVPPQAIRDREDAAKQKQSEAAGKTWDRAVAAAAMSPADLAKIKDSDPWMYLAATTGILQPTIDFFNHAPEAKRAYLAGEKLKLSSYWMSDPAKHALVKMTQGVLRVESRLGGLDEAKQQALSAKFAELEAGSDKLTVRIQPESFIAIVEGYVEDGGIPTQDNEFLTLLAGCCIRALESGGRLIDEANKIRPQLKQAIEQDRKVQEAEKPKPGCEPGTVHSDDLLRSDLLTENAGSRSLAELLASLAIASGFSIVTADTDGGTELKFAKGCSLREALDKLAETNSWNWDRNSKVIEIWPADWHELRESRVPKAWLASIARKIRDNGTLEIDDLAELAALNEGQRKFILQDKTLACLAAGGFCENVEMLRLYSLFTAEQRASLFSESGLYFADLQPDQQQPILAQFKREYIPEFPRDLIGLGVRFFGTKVRQGQAWLYSLSVGTKQGMIPGAYQLKTPVYVEPKQAAASVAS